MFPTDNYPLARRDILTLAGLAWISPASAFGYGAAGLSRRRHRPPTQLRQPRHAGVSSTRCSAICRRATGRSPATKRREEERDGYLLETWDLDLNGIEPVPAYLARPTGASGRRPAVIFNHSHGGGYTIGKQEFIDGRSYLQPVPYAKELTGLGYVALCVDHWVFGERSHATEPDMFKAMLWQGQVLWGMMVYDSLRALDFLARARRRRPRAHRDARHLDGQHHGLVAGRPRRTRQGDGGHLLPHRLHRR